MDRRGALAHPRSASEAGMQAVVPTLRIRDYERSRRFYVDGMGFQVDWKWRHEPGHPLICQVSRAGMRLYLSENEGDCPAGGLVHLYVTDVDAWQAELLSRGILAEHPPVNQPWGNREMLVQDPDGNKLCICKALSGTS
jgi:catechol 2,3-dioxygenase-like lactoylglutathione lyase family enzyme